jgi:S1-C subfamily serine protease
LEAKLVKASRLFDLAVLKTKGSFKALPLDFNRRMALGDSVFTIGFLNVDIQGAAPKYTDGKVSSLSGAEDDPSQYQISVPVQPGNSGGPLVAETGSVVGIVRAKLNDLAALASSGSVPQNVNYAVKVKYLRDLLETIPGATDRIKSPSGNVKANENVKAAEDATVIVLVY